VDTKKIVFSKNPKIKIQIPNFAIKSRVLGFGI
jgi:hypothetical protein